MQTHNGLRVPIAPDEIDLKRRLNSAGISVPSGVWRKAGEAVHLVDDVREASVSAPYVVKAVSPGIAHKTEAGALIVDVSAADLLLSVERMAATFPDARILVEELVAYRGPELILGCILDQVFGPSLMVGAGGIFTELYRDVSCRLLPVEEADVEAMLDELRVGAVLKGYRGVASSAAGFLDVVRKFTELYLSMAPIPSSLEINPLVLVGDTWAALDVKAATAEEQSGEVFA